MKKIIKLVLLISILGGSYYYFNIYIKENMSDLEKMVGKEEATRLTSKYDEDIIYKMINLKDYDSDKLDDYMVFYNNNKDVKLDNIIKVVNNNIDKLDGFVYDDVVIDLIDEKYYIYDNTIRYMNYINENKDLTLSEVVANVNSNLDYAFYTNTTSVDMSYDTLMLVNKYYKLDEDYEPEDLVYMESPYSYKGGYVRQEVYNAFKDMVNDAYKEDINLYSVSPYRSYQTQKGLYELYASGDGYERADTYSARAGFSEHQTGLAIDINSTDDSFAYTEEAKWLKENAYRYGFILRYPKDKEYITGYQFEPWHYRYVGIDVSTKIYELDITFEEYYAYYIKK